jgi:serine/threonine protein kinase
MTLERGSLLNNRYQITEILGQGMAAVYRAIDENLSVEVAVKENLFTTDEYARQFRLEATILAGLRQPNLPRVSDHFVIEPQGQYLVMDYIEGEDLRQRLDRLGPLPEQEVIIIGVAICDAMAYMHSRKPMILHRDIKPGNVRITPSGHIYLVDFGLAKLVEGKETTNTGARAMTPGYSPPEQYGSARTDPRSDIYSLGATLYTGLTDVLPEDGLDRVMGRLDLTSIQKHNPKVSDHVITIIENAWLSIQKKDTKQLRNWFALIDQEHFKAEITLISFTTSTNNYT